MKRDAAYRYYDHGPLRRTVMGQQRLQGCDYAYTLQGWIKGVNGSAGIRGPSAMDPEQWDMNHDGIAPSYGAMGQVPNRDLYGYGLVYFTNGQNTGEPGSGNDYTPIGANDLTWGSFEQNVLSSNLYNGNISFLADVSQQDDYASNMRWYYYDQLNRITYLNHESRDVEDDLTANYSYDADGNLTNINRNSTCFYCDGETELSFYSNYLTHNYTSGINLLSGVSARLSENNAAFYSPYEALSNDRQFEYDRSGNLTGNTTVGSTDLAYSALHWTPYGKVSEVITSNQAGDDPERIASFGYGPDQNRWVKSNYFNRGPDLGGYDEEYQVRDAQGNVIATYYKGREVNSETGEEVVTSETPLTLRQQYLYGSSRLGQAAFNRELFTGSLAGQPITIFGTMSVGDRSYELANHLGNVTTVFPEAVHTQERPFGNIPELTYEVPKIKNFTNYLPFGLELQRSPREPAPGSDYRYGFNGKEQDTDGEWGSQTHYDYGFRIYNPAIARFLSVDPLAEGFAYNSSYAYAENSPIAFIDLDGGQKVYFSAGIGHDATNSGYIRRMQIAASSKGFDFVDVFAHSQPHPNAPLPIPSRDAAFSGYNNGYGSVPYYDIPSAIGPLAKENLPTIGSKRNQSSSGVDWRIKESQAQIKESLKKDPLGPNETLTLMGGSGGSVVIAQTALKMANEGTVVDNLILLASPVPIDSRLFTALTDHENIKRIFYIELEGDDITGIAAAKGKYGKLKSLISEMKRLGDYHPHNIITWSEKLPIQLFQTLEGDYDIEEKGGEGVIKIKIPYEDIRHEEKRN